VFAVLGDDGFGVFHGKALEENSSSAVNCNTRVPGQIPRVWRSHVGGGPPPTANRQPPERVEQRLRDLAVGLWTVDL
jgi:hypothetical protein